MLREQLFRDLATRYFQGTNGLDYQVAVIASGAGRRVLYASDPGFGSDLIPLTLLPVAFHAFGLLYLVSALALGALFIRDVIGVIRATEWNKPAWRLYKFSLLYLALLFAAMVVDRLVSIPL